MFGRLRPKSSHLTPSERQAYKAGYCGLCQSLRRESGRLSTLTLSYELTFLAHLEAAHGGGSQVKKTATCTAIPWRQVPSLLIPPKIGALGLVLASLKLEDDRRDEGTLKARLGLRLLEPKAAQALKTLEAAGFPLTAFARLSTEQTEVENALDESKPYTVVERIHEASKPSGGFTQAVFAWLAEGWPISTVQKTNWRDFGRLLGEAIYLIDALEDRAGDARRGSFNPLSNLKPENVLEVQKELQATGQALIKSWSEQPNQGGDSWPALTSSVHQLSEQLTRALCTHQKSSPDRRLQGLRKRKAKAAYCVADEDDCCEMTGGLFSGLCWFAGSSHREKEMERVHGDLLDKPQGADAPKELQRIPPFLPGNYACPSCETKPMDRQPIGAAGLFHCGKCSGVWLNGAHLPELRKHKETKDFVTFPQAGAPPVHPPGTRLCPIDGETLELSRENGVTVEECPTCQGWYLDAGELGSFL